MTLRVIVRYISIVRDKVGKDYEEIIFESDQVTLGELLETLDRKYNFSSILGDDLIVLINGKRLDQNEYLPAECSVVIAPPVSGG